MKNRVLRFGLLSLIACAISLLIMMLFSFNLSPQPGVAQSASSSYSPTSAIIDWVGGSLSWRYTANPRIASPTSGNSLTPSRRLLAPGHPNSANGAGIALHDRNGQLLRQVLRVGDRDVVSIGGNTLVLAGFSQYSGDYWFPCSAINAVVIGRELIEDNRQIGQSCSAFRLGPDPRSQGRAEDGEASFYARHQQKQTPVQEPQQPTILDWDSINQYCSVVSTSGAWAVEYSRPAKEAQNQPGQDEGTDRLGDDWGPQSMDNICRRAWEQVCSADEGAEGGNCRVANMGEWRNYDRNLTLVLDCQDREPFIQFAETAYQIYDPIFTREERLIEQMTEAAQSSQSCVLTVYRQHEVLVTPSTTDPTLFQGDINENGDYQINVLAGEIRVTPAKQPNEAPTEQPLPVIVKTGEKYIYSRQPDQIYVGSDQAIPIDTDERRKIVSSPAIQAFLSLGNWSDVVQEKIEQYRKLVEDNFASLAQPAIAGTINTRYGQVWRAVVDLNSLKTIPTIETIDVSDPANLEQFVRTRQPAIVTSGSFASDGTIPDGWTARKSGGEFLLNTGRFANWGQGTVFGIKRGNTPEMITPRDPQAPSPEWDDYWFGLSGGPRLLSEGSLWFNPQLEGFRQDNMTNPNASAPRAAIGFSSRTKQLYFAIAERNLTLPQMAEVMQELGCDEAMNLDGGNTRALAYRGNMLYRPGRRSSRYLPQKHILVFYDALDYDENRIPQSVLTIWDAFQAETNASSLGE